MTSANLNLQNELADEPISVLIECMARKPASIAPCFSETPSTASYILHKSDISQCISYPNSPTNESLKRKKVIVDTRMSYYDLDLFRHEHNSGQPDVSVVLLH